MEGARRIQSRRFRDKKIVGKKYNSEMSVSDIEKIIRLEKDVIDLLKTSTEKLGLSARAYHRIIKLARTIADLEKSKEIINKESLEFKKKTPLSKGG